MKISNPNNGNVVGFQFKNVLNKHIKQIKQKLEGIPEKYIEYALLYIPDSISKDKQKYVIIFHKLSEYQKAVDSHRALYQNNLPRYFVGIWIGGHTLHCQVKINNETKPILKKLQESSLEFRSDYNGIDLRDEINEP